MKLSFSLLIYWVLLCISACNPIDNEKQPNKIANKENENSYPQTAAVLKDFMTWYNYTYSNIHLARDFIGLDTDSGTIDKTLFLSRLASGKFLPLKLNNNDRLPTYKLFSLNTNDRDIESTMKQMALHEISNDQMVGKELPDFNFTDLKGIQYNKSVTQGKILILKCWFIHCIACVKEFPELNKLVDAYKHHSNMLFVSLATDKKPTLLTFLKERPFYYATVPNSGKYITDSLGIQDYPTHILIGKNGKIIKVVNTVDDLKPFLKIESDKEH